MATLAETMAALADQVRGVLDDVTDIDLTVEGVRILAATGPTIDIFLGDESYDQTVAGFGDLQGGDMLTVRATVNANDPTAAQELLYAFADDEDPLSVVAALTYDETVGGRVQTMDVLSRSGVGVHDQPSDRLGVTWRVLIVRGHS